MKVFRTRLESLEPPGRRKAITTMPASEAQISANRRNAALSTGPKTQEGKDRSRLNALKHGLTAESVPMSTEDAALVDDRFRDIQEELQPTGTASRLHLRRYAFLSVRLENCEKLHLAVYARRVRHAEDEFDDHRLTLVEALASRVESETATSVRRLQAMPEGIDWLIGEWGELRLDLMNRERDAWTRNHSQWVERLLGRPHSTARQPRSVALHEAMSGYFANINASEIVGLTDPEKSEWARKQLLGMIDAEVERLQAVKAALDPRKVEQDRTEAADRCLFDLQPSMDRVRKYEAATERSMYRAMKEFRLLESEPTAIPSPLATGPAPAELASFEPQPQEKTAPAKARSQPTPRTMTESPQLPESLHTSGKKGLDSARIHLGIDQNNLL